MSTGRALRLQQALIRNDGKREGLVEGMRQGAEQATADVLAYIATQVTDAKVAEQLITDIKAGRLDTSPTVDAEPVAEPVVAPEPEPVAEPVAVVEEP